MQWRKEEHKQYMAGHSYHTGGVDCLCELASGATILTLHIWIWLLPKFDLWKFVDGHAGYDACLVLEDDEVVS